MVIITLEIGGDHGPIRIFNDSEFGDLGPNPNLRLKKKVLRLA